MMKVRIALPGIKNFTIQHIVYKVVELFARSELFVTEEKDQYAVIEIMLRVEARLERTIEIIVGTISDTGIVVS